MGSGSRGTAQDYIANQQNWLDTQRGSLNTGLQGQLKGAQGDYRNAFDTATRNYANFDPYAGSLDLSGIGGVSGGIDPRHIGAFGSAFGGYQNFAQNGGLSPEFNAQFAKYGNDVNTAINQFKDIYGNPVDPVQQQQMLGNGTFQNFINTGGYSANDIQNLRTRSLSPLLSTFSNANDEINRTRALQGGYSPNTTAALATNARNLGYGAADASTNVEAGLAESIRSGKMWGAQGMSTAGTNLADLLQRGKISSATGLANTAISEQQTRLAVQRLDDEMRMAGLAGMTDIEKTRLQAELQNAQINMSAGAANAGIQLGKAGLINQRDLAEKGMDLSRIGGQAGLASLAGSQQQDAWSNLLNNMAGWQSGRQALTNNFMQSFDVPNGWDSGLGYTKSALGILGTLGKGFGAGGWKSFLGFGGGNNNGAFDENGNFVGQSTFNDLYGPSPDPGRHR